MSPNNRTSIQGYTNLRPQSVRAAKFYSVTLFICGSWQRNLAHVTILGPRILQWLIDFWKICGSLTLSILALGSVTTTENPPPFFFVVRPWPKCCTIEPSPFLSVRSKCLIIRLHCHVRQRFTDMENNQGKKCVVFEVHMTVEVWNVTSGSWEAYRVLGGTCLKPEKVCSS